MPLVAPATAGLKLQVTAAVLICPVTLAVREQVWPAWSAQPEVAPDAAPKVMVTAACSPPRARPGNSKRNNVESRERRTGIPVSYYVCKPHVRIRVAETPERLGHEGS